MHIRLSPLHFVGFWVKIQELANIWCFSPEKVLNLRKHSDIVYSSEIYGGLLAGTSRRRVQGNATAIANAKV